MSVAATVMSEEDAHAEALVRRSGTSFYWGMRVLPEEKRNAMFAVYAFCRVVDDIADEPGEEEEKRRQLQQWRDEVDRLFEGEPTMPVARALAGPVKRFGLYKRDFLAVIDGMEMDAGDKVRIQSMDELTLYIDRVACAVGRLSNRVFGVDDETGDKIAHSLGSALQLTNILRDIREDADIDRVYLPADRLSDCGIRTDDAKAIAADQRLQPLCEMLAQAAELHFRDARELLAGCDQQMMKPAIMMMEVYHRILIRLNQRGWSRVADPVRVSKVEKLWIAVRHGMI